MDETQTEASENTAQMEAPGGDSGNHLERALHLELPVIAVLAEKEI